MLGDYKALNLTKIGSKTSLLYMLKILIKTLYLLPLVLPTYISIIYIFIYLNLMNIRILKRPKDIKLLFRTLLKILILLLTSFTVTDLVLLALRLLREDI